MMGKALIGASVVALAATGVLAPPAKAQQGMLEEIIVTAQKREQNIQDVPISITAVSGEKLDVISSAGADIRFLRMRIPSVYAESSFGRAFPRFYIRGLGNTDFDLNSSQPVSLIYDGVVLENPILKGIPAFDLDRIEVLRGPQGTLFGRNTPAGIIKFESKKPTRELDGYVNASYGRFNGVDIEAAFGGPLTDSVMARAAILYQRQDDWIDNEFTGENNFLGGFEEIAGRFQILIEPNNNFSALLNAHFRSLDGTARVFRANIIQQGTGGLVSGFDREKVLHDGDNFQDIDEFGFVGTLEYDFGTMTLTSVTGYETIDVLSRGDVDGGVGVDFLGNSQPGSILISSETADGIPDHDQLSQEIRLASNAGELFDWQIGFFYFSEDYRIDSFSFDTLFAGGAQNGFALQFQDTDAWAVFGSIEYDINDQTRLAGGVRYSSDEKDFTAERTQSPLGFLGQPLMPPVSITTDDEVVSWDVSLTYRATEEVSWYARAARSFRAPSIQGRVLFAFGDGTDLESSGISVGDTETILSFEGGIKAELMQRSMRFNANFFYYNMDNQQLTAVGGVTNINRLVNADKTVGFGFEADLEWAVNEYTFLTAGASYNDTEIKDPNLTITPCGAPCTVLDPVDASGAALLDGNSLPQAPKWIFNGTLRYGMPFGDNGELYFFTDWAYRSKVRFFLYESVEFQDDHMIEGGIRIGYVHNSGQYEIAFFGRNITNDTSLTGGIDFSNLTGFVNEPRVWGVEVGARF